MVNWVLTIFNWVDPGGNQILTLRRSEHLVTPANMMRLPDQEETQLNRRGSVDFSNAEYLGLRRRGALFCAPFDAKIVALWVGQPHPAEARPALATVVLDQGSAQLDKASDLLVPGTVRRG